MLPHQSFIQLQDDLPTFILNGPTREGTNTLHLFFFALSTYVANYRGLWICMPRYINAVKDPAIYLLCFLHLNSQSATS